MSQSDDHAEIVVQIFLSGTYMAEEREAANRAVRGSGHIAITMEDWGALAVAPVHVVEHMLTRRTDALVCVMGERYGSLLDVDDGDPISYSEWEWNVATNRGLDRIAFVMDVASRDRRRSALFAAAETDADRHELRLDFDLQERFIQRVLSELHVAAFSSPAELEAAVSQALPALVRRLEGDGTRGLIARSRYTALDVRAAYLSELIQLLLSSSPTEREGTHPMTRDRLTIETRLKRSLIQQTIERNLTFSTEKGLQTESFDEAARLLWGSLFGTGLTQLQAVSVDNAYWLDPGLREFRDHNLALLESGGTLERLFTISLLRDVLDAPWLLTMLDQVERGATCKVAELPSNRADWPEDYGVYHVGSNGGEIVLVRELPHPRSGTPRISISTNQGEAGTYVAAFKRDFARSGAPVRVIRNRSAGRRHNFGASGEQVTVGDLVENRVMLRRMVRQYDYRHRQPSFPAGASFRKYEVGFAEIVAGHLSEDPELRNRTRLVYIGDTAVNDGGCIRNLQVLGLKVDGFVCDRAQIGCFEVRDVMYSDDWSDLADFAAKVDGIGNDTALILDVDATLWGPSGIQEGPLRATRVEAIRRIVKGYRGGVTRAVTERIADLYELVSLPRYAPLMLDDECRKAAATALISVGAFGSEIAGGTPTSDSEYYSRLDGSPRKRLLVKAERYLDDLVDRGDDLLRLLIQSLAILRSEPYAVWCASADPWLDWRAIEKDALDVQRALVAHEPVIFSRFRDAELSAMLTAADSGTPLPERLVANWAAVDFVAWAKRHGAIALGLSDRPEEATLRSDASLLDTPLTVFGESIADRLRDL